MIIMCKISKDNNSIISIYGYDSMENLDYVINKIETFNKLDEDKDYYWDYEFINRID